MLPLLPLLFLPSFSSTPSAPRAHCPGIAGIDAAARALGVSRLGVSRRRPPADETGTREDIEVYPRRYSTSLTIITLPHTEQSLSSCWVLGLQHLLLNGLLFLTVVRVIKPKHNVCMLLGGGTGLHRLDMLEIYFSAVEYFITCCC